MKFKFEDYKTAEEAQAALLELHPLGSDIGTLKNTLEIAGCSCGPITNPRYKNNPKYQNLLYCKYKEKALMVFTYEWQISIHFNDRQILTALELTKNIQSL